MMNGAFVVVIVASLSLAAVSTRPYENSALRASRRYTGPSGRLPCVDQAMVADLAQAALASGASIPAALKALHCALGEEEEASGLDVAPALCCWAEGGKRHGPTFQSVSLRSVRRSNPPGSTAPPPCPFWNAPRLRCAKDGSARRGRRRPHWAPSSSCRSACASFPHSSSSASSPP